MPSVQPLISFQQYGKENVRLVKVIKQPCGKHELLELKISVLLSGKAFDESYTKADNKNVVATDSIKNIIYVVANSSTKLPCIEKFGIELGEFMLSKYLKLVEKVQITIEKVGWERLVFSDQPHPYAFSRNVNGLRKCQVVVSQGTKPLIMVRSEISDLSVIKTTGSAFENFYRDQFTTLPESKDRILSTSIGIRWSFVPFNSFEVAYSKYEFCKAYDIIRDICLYEFACVDSPSVQATLYKTCRKVLDGVSQVDQVDMELPNHHVFTLDLPVFNHEAQKTTPPKDMYIPIGQPNGLIRASVCRASASKL